MILFLDLKFSECKPSISPGAAADLESILVLEQEQEFKKVTPISTWKFDSGHLIYTVFWSAKSLV